MTRRLTVSYSAETPNSRHPKADTPRSPACEVWMWWWLPTPAHCEVSWQNKGGGCSLERCGKFGKKSCHILLWCYFSCFIPLSRHYDHESRDLHAGLHQLRHNGSLSKKPNQLFKNLSVLSSKLLCFHNVKVILDVQTEHWKTRSGTSTFIGKFCRSKHRVFFHHSEPLSPSHCFRFQRSHATNKKWNTNDFLHPTRNPWFS